MVTSGSERALGEPDLACLPDVGVLPAWTCDESPCVGRHRGRCERPLTHVNRGRPVTSTSGGLSVDPSPTMDVWLSYPHARGNTGVGNHVMSGVVHGSWNTAIGEQAGTIAELSFTGAFGLAAI